MEDSGVVRLPHYDDFFAAFQTQLTLNPPENHHKIFEKIPTIIMSSDTDLLFPPSVIRKQLEEKYHELLQVQKNLDHNLEKNDSAMKLANLAKAFFEINLL